MNIIQFRGGDELGDALLFAFPFWAEMTAEHLRAAADDGPNPLGIGQVANDILFGLTSTRRCEVTAEFVVRTVARTLARRRDRDTPSVAVTRLLHYCTTYDPFCNDVRYWLRFAKAFEAAADEVYVFIGNDAAVDEAAS